MKRLFLRILNFRSVHFLQVILCLIPVITVAATINVSSIAALQSAINSSVSGDIINLANGHYENNTISISKSNITVQASTPGGVYLDGTNSITISGNTNTFSGFQFISGVTSGANVVTVTGNYNTITQLNFNGYSAGKMVQISGLNNTVSYCNFQNKPTNITLTKGGDGDMLQIIPNATNPGNNIIRYCSFQHMPGGGGDWGNECIRIGDDTYSLMISGTVVEYCYFEDTGLGDSEAISVKSRDNVLRYNTMNNNPNAMFSFRNGDNNVAYSNFFIASGGIRCKQSNNIYCYNNYFGASGTNQTPGLPGSGTAPVYLEYFGAGYGNNFNLIHNTFYGCTPSVIQTPLTNCTWANNIFYNSSQGIFTGTTSGLNFVGNIYDLSTVGLAISSGMTNTDPELSLNSDGYYGLTSTSPAIGKASAAYPAMLNLNGIDTLLLDIKGQNRPVSRLLKDVGCEQFTTGTITNRPLKLADVGPYYLIGTTEVNELTNNNIGFQLSPNPSNGNITIDYHLSNEPTIHLNIYNLNGICVKSMIVNRNKSEGNQKQTYDIPGLENGVYLAQLKSDNISATIKLLINK